MRGAGATEVAERAGPLHGAAGWPPKRLSFILQFNLHNSYFILALPPPLGREKKNPQRQTRGKAWGGEGLRYQYRGTRIKDFSPRRHRGHKGEKMQATSAENTEKRGLRFVDYPSLLQALRSSRGARPTEAHGISEYKILRVSAPLRFNLPQRPRAGA